jgi:hypothetical protein
MAQHVRMDMGWQTQLQGTPFQPGLDHARTDAGTAHADE